MAKILLIDDVKQQPTTKQSILSSSRVQILKASSGTDALDVARRELPNLIVMDERPDANGIDSCREIKADPQLRHIPVIILAAAEESAAMAGYLAAGANDCLLKPVDNNLFHATLKRYLPAVACREERVSFCTEVRLTVNNDIHIGMTRDISSKGIYVASEMPAFPGDELLFSFVVPGSAAPLEVKGKVSWYGGKYVAGASRVTAGFGVEFLEITGEGAPSQRRRELESFVSRQAVAAASAPLWS